MLDYGAAALILFSLLSLAIGSFLGLFVHRFPQILKENARSNRQLLVLMFQNNVDEESLTFPRSHCDLCSSPITFLENIPLLSFLFLKGECAKCKGSIPRIYFAIELVTVLSGLCVLYKVGYTSQLGPLLILTWSLIALSFIDLTNKLLPDQITIPLVWAGLITNIFFEITPMTEAIVGAVLGYLSLWLLFWLYKFSTDKEAIGYGDFKLLAALGAWFGIAALSPILLIAAIGGLVFAVVRFFLVNRSLKEPIAFGPFLSVGAFAFLVFREQINYLLNSLI